MTRRPRAATTAADARGPLAGIDLAAAAATPGAWLELAVAADHEAVEAVSEILSRAAPGGTSRRARVRARRGGPRRARRPRAAGAACAPTCPLVDVAAGRARPSRARTASSAISRRSGCGRSATLTTRVVHEADWANAWKAHFPVLRVGRRIVIRPTWRRHRRRPDDVVLALDPGMAFGTGLHPTTRLCLAALEGSRIAGPADGRPDGGPARVLDVGCGSGILAIAAGAARCRRGARRGRRPDRGRGHRRERAPQPARRA